MPIIYGIAVLVGIVVVWVIIKMRKGYLVGVYLRIFEWTYDEALAQSGSKQSALRIALDVFQRCPKLKRLSTQDKDRIAQFIGPVPDPKKVIRKVLLDATATKALEVLRNEAFLRDVAAVYSKTPKN